jgi:hypothetical protein
LGGIRKEGETVMDTVKYLNEVIVRLEELLYHELSGCASWKTEFVGIDFIQSKNIEGKTLDEIVTKCIKEIKAEGLVKDISYLVGGNGVLLRLKIKHCIHLPKEVRLKKDGVAPYICPITNMIVDQIIEKLKYETSYVAKLDIREDAKECTVFVAIYETPEKIGEVSDWTQYE